MKISLLTLFPDIVHPFFDESLMARAGERGILDVEVVDIRSFAFDKHRTCDDYTYGGGPGMVLKPEPVVRAVESVLQRESCVVMPSPSGFRFDQHVASELASEKHLVLICGRYEGVDQRVIDSLVDLEVSIGDYVMSSGELAALVVIDATARLLDGFLNAESLEQESFSGDLLEYPHYTRPETFRGAEVPEVLRNGHHGRIDQWRSMKRLEKTAAMRPDLFSRRIMQKKSALSIQMMQRHGRGKGEDHE